MFNGIDGVALALLAFAVVGAVEFVKRLFDRDYRGAAIIAVSVLIGAVCAPYAGSVTHFQGALIGLQASGLITTASYI